MMGMMIPGEIISFMIDTVLSLRYCNRSSIKDLNRKLLYRKLAYYTHLLQCVRNNRVEVFLASERSAINNFEVVIFFKFFMMSEYQIITVEKNQMKLTRTVHSFLMVSSMR